MSDYRSEYQRKWREANRERLREYQRAYRATHTEERRASHRKHRAIAQAALDALRAGPCVDCGVQYPPAAMEFDHVRGVKRFEITTTNYRHRGFAEELAKCELRCANCHRIRHASVNARRYEDGQRAASR